MYDEAEDKKHIVLKVARSWYTLTIMFESTHTPQTSIMSNSCYLPPHPELSTNAKKKIVRPPPTHETYGI